MKKYLLLFVFLFAFSFKSFFTSNISSKKPIVIAHRGASAFLPEHTLESFSLAAGLKADFIEPDLVLTKDNIPIIVHDIYLESTTNVKEVFPQRKRKDGHFYALDFTLAEVKKLKVGERVSHKDGKQVFPARFPSHLKMFSIPSFVEFLDLIKGLNQSMKKQIGIYPEIKRPDFHRKNKKDITKIVYKILEKYHYEKNNKTIYIQSFDPTCLQRLKNEFKTKIPLIQLVSNENKELLNLKPETLSSALEKIKEYAAGIGPHYMSLVEKRNKAWKATLFASLAQDKGLLLHPYTLRKDAIVGDFSSFEELVSTLDHVVKVDGYFTDFVEF